MLLILNKIVIQLYRESHSKYDAINCLKIVEETTSWLVIIAAFFYMQLTRHERLKGVYMTFISLQRASILKWFPRLEPCLFTSCDMSKSNRDSNSARNSFCVMISLFWRSSLLNNFNLMLKTYFMIITWEFSGAWLILVTFVDKLSIIFTSLTDIYS